MANTKSNKLTILANHSAADATCSCLFRLTYKPRKGGLRLLKNYSAMLNLEISIRSVITALAGSAVFAPAIGFQAADDVAAVKEFSATNYAGKKWNRGQAKVDTPEVRQAYPGSGKKGRHTTDQHCGTYYNNHLLAPHSS